MLDAASEECKRADEPRGGRRARVSAHDDPRTEGRRRGCRGGDEEDDGSQPVEEGKREG
jgi:hypothetical protein